MRRHERESSLHDTNHPPFVDHELINPEIMADQLNMGGLSLNGQQQQPSARSYIPPHMRAKMAASQNGPPAPNGPPPMNAGPHAGGLNNSAWAKYVSRKNTLLYL